jgi:cytochrome c oxidase subunit 4
MEATHTEDIKKHIKVYIIVFVSLMILTVVTVAVSYLHLSTAAAVAVALVIATIKGSLVACYFMHLISEKKFIYGTLILTVVFFIALMFLPMFANSDPIVIK